LTVSSDYLAALALRQMAALVDDLPKYLLAPEVSALLHFMPDLRRKMLFTTLWNIGARTSEALALTRGDFCCVSSIRSCSWPRSSSSSKGRSTGRTPRRRRRASPAGAAARRAVRDAAGDDGCHPADSAGA